MQANDALVLGFDGVPWSRIEEWTDTGELPNFARLRDEGAAGQLTSTTPATTALAWPSIATGVRPDKHGIYWFRDLKPDYTHRTCTSEDVRRPTLWEMVSPSIVGNVPMTYPASSIDGELVAGMMTPGMDADGFTYPPSLSSEIRERIPSYRIGLDWTSYSDNPDEILDDINDLVDTRIELLQLLFERDWRLFFFVFTAPDRLQHLIWDEEVILEHYRKLDELLGDVLQTVDDRGVNLFVVSDHGFGPISNIVSGNAILEQSGYIARKGETRGTRNLLGRLGITKDQVSSWLTQVGASQDDVVRYLPQAFVDMVALQIPGEHVLYDIDYGETAAFFHGSGTLYVNDTDRFEQGTVDPADVSEVKRAVTHEFASVTDPETGDRVLRVFDGDDLFPTDPGSPDLVVKGIDGYETHTKLSDSVFLDPEATAASHRREGIFLARGPDIEPGVTLDSLSVYDVAPTVLHALGRPVPEAMDGSVIWELFSTDSEIGSRDIEYDTYSGIEGTDEVSADFDTVKDRLRGLGYLE